MALSSCHITEKDTSKPAYCSYDKVPSKPARIQQPLGLDPQNGDKRLKITSSRLASCVAINAVHRVLYID